jgi:hypothetical protein
MEHINEIVIARKGQIVVEDLIACVEPEIGVAEVFIVKQSP